MRSGIRLGIDVGRARIGVSRSDPAGSIATPVETVSRDARGGSDLDRIVSILAEISEYGSPALEVVVGLPLNLRGEDTQSTGDAREFAARLAVRLGRGTPVRLVDERLSTVSAQGHLREAGKKTKQTRGIIDQAAAVVILQHALDLERSLGEAPGEPVAAVPSTAAEGDH